MNNMTCPANPYEWLAKEWMMTLETYENTGFIATLAGSVEF